MYTCIHVALQLEESPKWHLLSLVLDEIKKDLATDRDSAVREGGERETKEELTAEGDNTTREREEEGEVRKDPDSVEGRDGGAVKKKREGEKEEEGEREREGEWKVKKDSAEGRDGGVKKEGEGEEGKEREGERERPRMGRKVLVVVNDERTCYQLRQVTRQQLHVFTL